ncbi:MAG: 30S ribosomal protein S16 [Microbacteriaceae bacterium]
MAVKIRLKRLGKIRSPHYRIVVADSRTKRDGRSIEEIGKYHPTENPSFIEIDSDRAQYWLSVGAQPSPQVLAILKLSGDWGKFKGDKNAKNMIQTKDAKVVFEEDTKKKSVIRPRVEKKVEEVVEAVAAVADDAVEAVSEAIDDVVENVAEVVADAAEAVAEAAEEVAEAVADEPAADEAPAEEAPAAEAAAEEAAEEAPSEDKAE